MSNTRILKDLRFNPFGLLAVEDASKRQPACTLEEYWPDLRNGNSESGNPDPSCLSQMTVKGTLGI